MIPSNTTTKPKSDFRGDKEAATYRWVLYLDNGKIFDGYSKNVGQAEKHDKQALLQDCIARLLNNGYLDKTYQMFFYKRVFLHRDQDTLLLEMYPTHAVAHDYLKLDLSTTTFLDRVYAARLTGQGLEYKTLLPPRATRKQQEEIDFHFTRDRFPTQTELLDYCKTTMLTRYPRERVLAWYKKCETYYPASAPVQTRLDPDPHNAQTAQAAQRAIEGLAGQFTVTTANRR
jgi:hypothetical protein